jgi:ubiquinone/menaquinone biosynthesis C-methylase UbiE
MSPAPSRWGVQYAHKTDAFSATKFWRRDAELALSKVQMPTGGKFLDLACGTGRMLQMAQAKFPTAHLIGVDVNEAGFRLCRSRAFAALTTDLTSVNDRSIDVCTIMHAIAQFTDPEATLTTLWDKMKPGGQLIVVVHNAYFTHLRRPYYWLTGYKRDATITNEFSLGKLASLMRDTGYLEDEAYYYGGGPFEAVWCLQPRIIFVGRRPH